VVVVVGEDPGVEAGREPEAGVGRGRRAYVAAFAALAVAIGGLVLVEARVGDPAEGDAAATPTIDRRHPSSTVLPPLDEPDLPRRLPVATGLRVVSFANVSIGITDLDTGEQTVISGAPFGGATGSVVARGRGLVWVNPSGQAVHVPDLVADPTIIDLGEGDSVVASDRADRVWIVVEAEAGASAVTEVDLSGRVTAGAITLPPGVSVVGGVPGGLVVGSPDGIFLVGRDGSARRIAGGTPVGTFGSSVVHHACDAVLHCDLHISEVATGEQRRIEGASEIPAFDPWATLVSPDGRFIAWLSFSDSDESPAATLNLYDLTTGRTASPLGPDAIGLGPPEPPSMAWSPDGQWLVVSAGATDRALRVEDGEIFELNLPPGGSGIVVLATRA
jgi:hypothetical protein